MLFIDEDIMESIAEQLLPGHMEETVEKELMDYKCTISLLRIVALRTCLLVLRFFL